MYLLEVYFQPVFLYLLYSWMRHVCFHITKQFNLNLYALVMGRCCQNLVKGGQLSLLNTTSFRNITGEQLKSELQQKLLIWDTFAISIWQYMKLSLHETCMKLMCSSTCAENAEQKLNLYETCMKLLCSSTSAENAEQVVGQFICHPNAWSWVKWNEQTPLHMNRVLLFCSTSKKKNYGSTWLNLIIKWQNTIPLHICSHNLSEF